MNCRVFRRGRHYRRRIRFPNMADGIRSALDDLTARITGRHSRLRRRLQLYGQKRKIPHR